MASLEDQYLDQWLDQVAEMREEFESELAVDDDDFGFRDYYAGQ